MSDQTTLERGRLSEIVPDSPDLPLPDCETQEGLENIKITKKPSHSEEQTVRGGIPEHASRHPPDVNWHELRRVANLQARAQQSACRASRPSSARGGNFAHDLRQPNP
ncbi:hypothetical protein MCOR02_002478 [Pyricularia oryzae]|nr:hypothetical protein MCOR02_002478 [Pyricularia oryzae]